MTREQVQALLRLGWDGPSQEWYRGLIAMVNLYDTAITRESALREENDRLQLLLWRMFVEFDGDEQDKIRGALLATVKKELNSDERSGHE